MLCLKIINKIKRVNLFLIFKSGLGSAFAIFIASRLNLLYSASAGIITLLTIQNTKKETLDIALKRIYAFLIAVILAYAVFSNIGYTILAFGVFVFIFVGIANILKIEVGISMNSVLITHFLVEARMDIELVTNEALILLIGMSTGILVNLIMPKNTEKIKRNQKIVEDKIREALSCMAKMLEGGQDCSYVLKQKDNFAFLNLNQLIDDLLVKAYEDAGNTLLRETKYRISYLEMRKHQVAILRDITESIDAIHDVLPESFKISSYINKVSLEFTESNNVKDLLIELEELYEFFRNEKLPSSREEFENRAILYNLLRDLEKFLNVKRSFIENY